MAWRGGSQSSDSARRWHGGSESLCPWLPSDAHSDSERPFRSRCLRQPAQAIRVMIVLPAGLAAAAQESQASGSKFESESG
jgi:hypothetical protein